MGASRLQLLFLLSGSSSSPLISNCPTSTGAFGFRRIFRFGFGVLAENLRSKKDEAEAGRRLLGVIGDVPSRALELDGRSGDYLLDGAAALGAFLDMRIGEFLDALEAVMALLALVFVKWHGLPETLLKKQVKQFRTSATEN